METCLLQNWSDSCRDHVARGIIPSQTASEGALRVWEALTTCVLCVLDTIQAPKAEVVYTQPGLQRRGLFLPHPDKRALP